MEEGMKSMTISLGAYDVLFENGGIRVEKERHCILMPGRFMYLPRHTALSTNSGILPTTAYMKATGT